MLTGCQMRFYLCAISIACLVYDLTYRELTRCHSDGWLTGYKLFFLLAATKSVVSYLCVTLNVLSEKIRDLQYFAISTTGTGETLALCREKRISCRDLNEGNGYYTKSEFGHPREIPFNPNEDYEHVPVFWCCFTIVFACYNTLHLLCSPVIAAFAFGLPMLALYWGVFRIAQVILYY